MSIPSFRIDGRTARGKPVSLVLQCATADLARAEAVRREIRIDALTTLVAPMANPRSPDSESDEPRLASRAKLLPIVYETAAELEDAELTGQQALESGVRRLEDDRD